MLDCANTRRSMPANPSLPMIRFSTFELNLQTKELRKQKQKLRLQQPFQILTALLEQPGDIVTREELRNKLWPSETFVDFDHSLNGGIKRLGNVLGNSAETPVFIETRSRRGYRFIYPFDGCSAANNEGVAATAETSADS